MRPQQAPDAKLAGRHAVPNARDDHLFFSALEKMPPKGLAASRKAKSVQKKPAETEDETIADEAALTIGDLFELRQTALEIFMHASPRDEDRFEEARGVLRGILHGCDGLRKLDEAHELAESLGLKREDAKVRLDYLEAFALHGLGLIVPAIPSAARITGSKKRKLDPREPTTPVQWFTEAVERYEAALAKAEGALRQAIELDFARCRIDLAAGTNALNAALKVVQAVQAEDDMVDVAQTAALAERQLVDGIDRLDEPQARLGLVRDVEDKINDASARADLAMVKFIALEDLLEAKYRPDATEDDVPSLPEDADDVKRAEEAGRDAARLLRDEIAKVPEDSEWRSSISARLWSKVFFLFLRLCS